MPVLPTLMRNELLKNFICYIINQTFFQECIHAIVGAVIMGICASSHTYWLKHFWNGGEGWLILIACVRALQKDTIYSISIHIKYFSRSPLGSVWCYFVSTLAV